MVGVAAVLALAAASGPVLSVRLTLTLGGGPLRDAEVRVVRVGNEGRVPLPWGDVPDARGGVLRTDRRGVAAGTLGGQFGDAKSVTFVVRQGGLGLLVPGRPRPRETGAVESALTVRVEAGGVVAAAVECRRPETIEVPVVALDGPPERVRMAWAGRPSADCLLRGGRLVVPVWQPRDPEAEWAAALGRRTAGGGRPRRCA